MNTTSFAHLHVHTEYSLLDGMSRVSQLAQQAKKLDMHHLAITDHGVLYGAMEFYKTCTKEGIHPIIGMEAYLCDDMSVKPKKSNEYNHLLLLAETQQGYSNLLKLCTEAHTRGYYYKPRIDKETLAQYAQGLIVTSSCLSGEIPELLLAGKEEEANKAIGWYQNVFGANNFFLELQEHHDQTSEQDKLNQHLYRISKEQHIPAIATNDLHYVHADDHSAHDVLLCVQTGAKLTDQKRFHFESQEYYLRSPQQMLAMFDGAPETISNTLLIAERCQVNPLANKAALPKVDVPDQYASADAYLYDLCQKGILERFGESNDALQQQLQYEFSIISQKGFVPYFLIVYDFVNYCRSHNIRCSARGSAAGSLVAYTLGITNVDPLRYTLLFERFLNPERDDMPDIDMDFPDAQREEVIRYIAQKYGYDCVAQMVTFNTMAAKSSVKDVARAMNLTEKGAQINKLLPESANTLSEALETSVDMQRLAESDSEVSYILKYAKRLEGTVRTTGTHAAGIVVGNTDLTNFVPLRPMDYKNPRAGQETQYEHAHLEELGLIKFDFLGLSNLTVLQEAVKFIQSTRGETVDLDHLPLDEGSNPEENSKREAAFSLLAAGETTGIFQLESPKMREYIKQLKPTCVEDIMAMIALYRPGPMESIPEYIDAKYGRRKAQYLDPRLKQWLSESYGVIVYQDQVLQIAVNLAGFSWGKVNKFRKALSKKIMHEVEGYKGDFLKGCVANGVKQEIAEKLFELILPFGGYGFNKAHAASYAVIAFQTAYLKANYPAEYLAAVLTKDASDATKIANAIAECRRMKVQVLGPDINKSGIGFTVEDGAIRFGLVAIKGIGEGPIQAILRERAHSPFASFMDFCERVEIKKSAVETLIKAGAMDSLHQRHVLLEGLDRVVKEAKNTREINNKGQMSLMWEEVDAIVLSAQLLNEDAPLLSQKQKLSWERELIGIYLSQHPLSLLQDILEKHVSHYTTDLTGELESETVTLAGTIQETREFLTKKGDMMCVVELEDLYGKISVTVFPKQYEQTKSHWRKDTVVIVTGKVQYRNEQAEILCSEVKPVPRAEEQMDHERHMLYLTIERSGESDVAISNDIMKVQKLHEILKGKTGRDLYEIRIVDRETVTRLQPEQNSIDLTADLHNQLRELLGEKNIEMMPLAS